MVIEQLSSRAAALAADHIRQATTRLINKIAAMDGATAAGAPLPPLHPEDVALIEELQFLESELNTQFTRALRAERVTTQD